MEDYYHFPTSLETTAEINTIFPVVQMHSSSRSRSSPSPSPRPRRASSRDDDDDSELRHHYLDACFRCARILAENRDIFMYRGDTPFCSEECRQQQIDSDEAAEIKRSKQSAAATREQQRQRQNAHRVPVWAR